MPWRIYRPAIVVGHSETGAMDKVDGPYYFFPLIKRVRDVLPALAAAGRGRPRRHQPGAGRLRRQGDGPPRPPARPRRRDLPPGQPRAAEHDRTWSTASARRPRRRSWRCRSTGPSPRGWCPRACCRGPCSRLRWSAAPCAPAWADCCSTRPSDGSGSRPRCSDTSAFPAVFASRRTERALLGSGLSVPDLDSYAERAVVVVGGLPRRLDQGRPACRRGAVGQDGRDHRGLVGHRPGHRGPGRQGRRRTDPGGARPGQARGHPRPDRGSGRRGARLRLRPVRPRRDRPADQAAQRGLRVTSTSWSTTPAARSGAR